LAGNDKMEAAPAPNAASTRMAQALSVFERYRSVWVIPLHRRRRRTRPDTSGLFQAIGRIEIASQSAVGLADLG